MEVAEKDFQRKKRGKDGRKNLGLIFGPFYDYLLIQETGNVDDFINTILSRLKITGFKSFFSSPRLVSWATAKKWLVLRVSVSPRKLFLDLIVN